MESKEMLELFSNLFDEKLQPLNDHMQSFENRQQEMEARLKSIEDTQKGVDIRLKGIEGRLQLRKINNKFLKTTNR